MKKKIITLALAVVMCISIITSVTAATSFNRVPSTFLGYDYENNEVEVEYNYVENIVVQIPGTEVTFELDMVSEDVMISSQRGADDIPQYIFNFYEEESRVIFTQEAVMSVGSYGWWYEDGIAWGTGDVVPGEWDLHMASGDVLRSDYTISHEQYLMKILEDGTLASYGCEEKAVAIVEFCFNTSEAYPYNTIVDISNFIFFDSPSYSIIDGANSVVNSNALTIKADGDFDKFTGVKVDGELVDSSNYTATEGSTIIEFKADYLKTLEAGEHTVSVVFTDGIAITNFEIEEENTDDTTNDNTNNNTNNDTNKNENENNENLVTDVEIPNTDYNTSVAPVFVAMTFSGVALIALKKKK